VAGKKLENMKLPELKKRAKKEGVQGYSTMRKAELLKLLTHEPDPTIDPDAPTGLTQTQVGPGAGVVGGPVGASVSAVDSRWRRGNG
jgi:hypothetical protein